MNSQINLYVSHDIHSIHHYHNHPLVVLIFWLQSSLIETNHFTDLIQGFDTSFIIPLLIIMSSTIPSLSVSTCCALCIIPSSTSTAYTQFNSIRKIHDRAFQRWMPHINILFPFIHIHPTDQQNQQQQQWITNMNKKFKEIKPFTVRIKLTHSTAHKGKTSRLSA